MLNILISNGKENDLKVIFFRGNENLKRTYLNRYHAQKQARLWKVCLPFYSDAGVDRWIANHFLEKNILRNPATWKWWNIIKKMSLVTKLDRSSSRKVQVLKSYLWIKNGVVRSCGEMCLTAQAPHEGVFSCKIMYILADTSDYTWCFSESEKTPFPSGKLSGEGSFSPKWI